MTGHRKGFTLLEVTVTAFLLSILVAMVANLSRSTPALTDKARWMRQTADDIQMTEMVLAKFLKSTSYPVTLTPKKIYDSADGPHSARFSLEIAAGIGRRAAAEILSGTDTAILRIPESAAEVKKEAGDDTPGKFSVHEFSLEKSPSNPKQGRLVRQTFTAPFVTEAPEYARAWKGPPDPAAMKLETSSKLLDHVDWVEMSVTTGPEPRVRVQIGISHPKDGKAERVLNVAAVSNVRVHVANP
jgi:prepilin-type N-terminal cleavage/methylation domain-containing protein